MDNMQKMIYIFLLFLSINILSSDWEFGVKAGLNYNHFEFTELYGDVKSFDDKYDFLLGGVGRKQINDWIIFNIEALYNRRSFDKKYNTSNSLYRIYYLEFPITMVLNFKELFLNFGFYVSKYLSNYHKTDVSQETSYIKDREDWGDLNGELNSWDFGYILGFGYRFKSFLIEVRYNKTMRDQKGNNPDSPYYKYLDYISQWSFNIGYFF